MRRASEHERRRLNDEFARLCAIRSVFGEERAIADHVTRLLTDLGLEVEEDDSARVSGAGCGNLLVRVAGRSSRTVLLCAHLDTVPHEGEVEPVCEDGGWLSAGDTILGADNKAAVAVLLAVVRRAVLEPPPVNLELLLTASEENALAGARAFDVERLRADLGYVLDQATPIGQIVMASPTKYRFEAHFHGRSVHAGLRPEEGRSAVRAAARAIAAMPHGRLDPETTANVGSIHGGVPGTNVVPDRCTVLGEVRSLDPRRAEAVLAQVIDACHDAGGVPGEQVDVDVDTQLFFRGYRHAPTQPSVVAAEAALRACGYTPQHITSGGGTDGNVFEAAGLPCTNLANGTERNHETSERVSVDALEGMLDVVDALLVELGG